MTPAAQSELVATYCATCHSERAKAGGLSLAGFNAMLAHESPATAEKMVRKLRAGMMPPAGAKRPPDGALDGLVHALETRLDEFAAVNPNPGLAALPAAEPRRVRARGEGPARRRRRRLGAAAARHHQPRLRQRRRRADVLADAARRLPARRQPGDGAGRRRSRQLGQRGHLQPAEDRLAAGPRRRARRSAPAAASRWCTPSRPTATTCSGSTSSPSRSASCSATPPPASRSRCRSTASGRRCSTSTRG